MADRPASRLGLDLVRWDWIGTGALAVTSAAAALVPDPLGVAHAVLSMALFLIGMAAMLWAFARGVSRSRSELIDTGGLFLLLGEVADPESRRQLRLALAVQVVAVVAAASIRPFTEVAFGILAPTYGVGLMAIWGARYGQFPPRPTNGRG